MKNISILGLIIVASTFMSGCSELIPKASELPSFYILNGVEIQTKKETNATLIVQDSREISSKRKLVTATLKVNASSAAAGFDSARMIYSRVPYKLEYFAHSQWIDTPARMLNPLIVNALEEKGSFSAVTLSPSSADANFSLDTQIVRIEQDFFTPKSRERLTVRATLIDNVKHTVIFVHEFDVTVTAETENPYGGVIAANEAVVKLLDDLVLFCDEAIITYQK